MFRLLTHLILFISLSLLACQNTSQQAPKPTPAKDGVFIHISHGSDDVHRVLMALNMAVIMSESKDVLLYFDIKGIEVVLKDAPDFEYSHFPSSQSQIQKLLDKGILLMACPGCLKAAGKTAEDLREGIQIADKNEFFNFTSGRILTLDY